MLFFKGSIMKKYSLLFLITAHWSFFAMENHYANNYYSDVRNLHECNHGQNFLFPSGVLEKINSSLIRYNQNDIFYTDLDGKEHSFKKSAEELYGKDPNLFKKIISSRSSKLQKKEIFTIMYLEYPCKCSNENTKCSKFFLKNAEEKCVLDFIIEKKRVFFNNEQDFFDAIIDTKYRRFCALRVALPYLKVTEQNNSDHYFTFIIDKVFDCMESNNTLIIKQEISNKIDNSLSIYLSILIDSNINPLFLNTPEGKKKLDSLNGEYFPKLKQMLENLVTK
jgi:hypothetical protein